MHNDPTEYQKPLDPTQYAYSQYPAYLGVPEIPPPPPRKKRFTLFAIIGIGIAVLAVGGILGVMAYGRHTTEKPVPTPTPQSPVLIATPTTAPTQMPTILIETPTPAPLSYSATDIYNDFYANGLGGPDPQSDTSWSCCTYAPEGGAIVWTDRISGWKLDLAVFATTQEAETDAGQLFSQGFYANVVHGCLLSYEKAVPTSTLSGYVQLMQTYCN